MRIISRRALREFAKRYPEAEQPMDDWYRVVKSTTYQSPADVKAQFGGASFLGDRLTVFNVGGNKFRIIAFIMYDRGRLYIRHVFTHRQYDTWNKQRR